MLQVRVSVFYNAWSPFPYAPRIGRRIQCMHVPEVSTPSREPQSSVGESLGVMASHLTYSSFREVWCDRGSKDGCLSHKYRVQSSVMRWFGIPRFVSRSLLLTLLGWQSSEHACVVYLLGSLALLQALGVG